MKIVLALWQLLFNKFKTTSALTHLHTFLAENLPTCENLQRLRYISLLTAINVVKFSNESSIYTCSYVCVCLFNLFISDPE